MDLSYDLLQVPAATALAVAGSVVAAVLDHRRGYIPNSLTYPGILAGLALGLAHGGVQGFGLSLAGLLAGSLTFFIAFAAGSCGGGDVKLMAALGALAGLPAAIDVTLAALMAGGVIAVLQMIRRTDAAVILRTAGLFAMLLPAGVKDAALVLKPRERRTVRFGVAAAAGLIWCLLLPDFTPLAILR